MSNDVTFRRINGRIVPIKLNKNRQELAQGAGMVAGGIGVSSASGKIYRAINRYATAKSVKAFRTLDKITSMRGSGTLFSHAKKMKAAGMAEKAMKSARAIGKFSAPLRIGGQLLGATMIGAGASKIVKSKKSKNNSEKIAAAVGAASFGAFLTGAYGGAGFRTAIKPHFTKAYPAIRKLKNKLHL